MNYSERSYEFKTLLLEVHKKNIRDYLQKPLASEVEILNGTVIDLSQVNDEVVLNAARDFEDFLFTSMDVCVYISKFNASKKNAIILSINKDIGEGSGYMGYRINVNAHNITIEGYDNRGITQALYFLEDLMKIRKAPFLKKQVICRRAVFERRISQSPFGMFEWPDQALLHLAHSGMDTIALWLKEFNKSKQDSYIDVNLLAERASKFGIDIYVTFYKQHNVHPTDENAYEFYDGIYGKLLKSCPKIKGIFLLGEATEFSSKDPNVGFAPRQKNYIDNIPTGKCTPGWWPCSDYAEWVDLIKKVARKYNPNLDVVLSTYNWGYAPEKDRIALINRLPQDVSINVTWDMFEQVQMRNSVQDVVDYSLNFVGPGKYFTSEAIAAKKRGIKLMANSQTSGRTWDFGMVPYEPMPYQWIKRYKGLIEASKTWDLKMIYENIHYAFHPSIISELEKYMFFTPFDGGYTPEQWLEKLIERDFGAENANCIDEAFKFFSEGITKYPATNEDQYGVFRTGPSYPFWMVNPKLGLNPLPEDGMIPVSRFNADKYYFSWYTPDIAGRNSLPGVRIFDEIALITEMRDSFIKGFTTLNEIQGETVNLIKLKALAKFMINSCTTAINYKNFYIKLQQLSCVGDKLKAQVLIDEIERILIQERENAQDTISAVKVDSRIGWEPEEDYLCDEKALLWKIRQIDHELNFTIKKFRESNSL